VVKMFVVLFFVLFDSRHGGGPPPAARGPVASGWTVGGPGVGAPHLYS
jgi:hypothetical protein